MFGSMILETAIGLILIYLMLSLVCTAFNELLAQMMKLRANNLAEGIRAILADPHGTGIAKAFYDHPLIKGFCRAEGKPSYIPPQTFARVLIDIVSMQGTMNREQDVRAAVKKLENPELKSVLLLFLDGARGDVKKWQEELETWFDDAMDRVAGWYKRKTQVMTLAVAFSTVLLTNADTIMLANHLARDTVLRAALLAQAEAVVQQPAARLQGPAPQESGGENDVNGTGGSPGAGRALGAVEQSLASLGSLGLPIGWSGEWAAPDRPSHPRDFPTRPLELFNKLLGLLVTTLAVSLGAPFWFDLLNRVTNIRAVGRVPAAKKASGGTQRSNSAD